MTNRSAAAIARAGVAHVPEDRLATGLIGGMDLSDNAILRDYGRPPLCNGPFLSEQGRLGLHRPPHHRSRREDARPLGEAAHPLRRQPAEAAPRPRAGRSPRLIVAVHPTRGVDVGATEAIHAALREQRARGAATLLISEDLDELLALSDRIAVLFDGRVMGILPARGADPEQIGLLMAGVGRKSGVGQSGVASCLAVSPSRRLAVSVSSASPPRRAWR